MTDQWETARKAGELAQELAARIAVLEEQLTQTVKDLRYTLAWFDKATASEFRRDSEGGRIWSDIVDSTNEEG